MGKDCQYRASSSKIQNGHTSCRRLPHSISLEFSGPNVLQKLGIDRADDFDQLPRGASFRSEETIMADLTLKAGPLFPLSSLGILMTLC